MTQDRADPHAEYTSRRLARQSSLADWRRWERWIVAARVMTAASTLVVVVAALRYAAVSFWWAATPVVVFIVLVAAHDRVKRSLARAERAAEHYESGLARLEDRWSDRGDDGTRFLDPAHLYADDLDVFGPGSLYQLLCTAQTEGGRQILAEWLLVAAAPGEIRARQTAVAELRERLDLREELALVGEEVSTEADSLSFSEWAGRSDISANAAVRLAAALLAVSNVAALGLWLLADYGPLPFAASAGVALAFSYFYHKPASRLIADITALRRDLEILAAAMERISSEPAGSPRLQSVQQTLDAQETRAAAAVRRLHLLADLLLARESPMWFPVAATLLWGTQLAFAVEAWRSRYGRSVGAWLRAVGEFEALVALSAYAYEHPDDPFPKLVDLPGVFEAEGLGHPLIPASRCVRNDLVLGREARILVVSGSNMSGKSTLLRALGTNAVLAQAGAPVRARSLTMSPLAVGASIAIRDSLQKDMSHFYAELVRLRGIMALTDGDRLVLFLIDEILHGTNSRDRLVGTESVIRRLMDAGAIGLATTHDLKLGDLAATLAPRVANVHFRDELVDGRIHFDYKLQPGLVTRSNALDLMRAMGLLD